ncbi:MAG TPA: hypothetical protein ENG03_05810 [Thioploca sp.]|nr:MAG: hypothetical protein B6247_24395 [Beggiatoa sp. 4572_84]RKZ55458.1 MAG: hypothetical protein DRR08_24310 [Gammaproteobacteria bacterium]HDN26600.1 hypothetical protein [Thioploca sp.]
MKFQFEKLGALDKKTEIELGDLTIICGKNNRGKTFASYAIYAFLKTWNSNIDFKIGDEIHRLLENGVLKLDLKSLEKNLPTVLDDISKQYTEYLSRIFSTNEDYFSKATFHALIAADYQPTYKVGVRTSMGIKEILKVFKQTDSSILEMLLSNENRKLIPSIEFVNEFINELLGRILLSDYFANPFIITSERTGISLFHRELDISKNRLIERLQEGGTNKLESTLKMINGTVSRYSRPIKDGIDFVRDIVEYSKKKSPLIKEHPELVKVFRNLVGGDYIVIEDKIYFSFKKGRKNHLIPIYLASSSVKSLLDINFYIKCLAQKGDILLIDEPEQNLHPANQRKMARLFVRLIKAGVKVFVTTHSDYLIKELNNLIILGNEFEDRDEILKKYKYTNTDVLEPSLVRVYIAEKQTLVPAPINELGIVIGSFDNEVREMNDMFDDMTMTMEIAYE